MYFGVKNNGDVIGQKDLNENTLRDVSRKISEGIKPQIIPHISLELIEDKKVIKVYAKGDNVPYSAFVNITVDHLMKINSYLQRMLKALINRDSEPDYIIKKVASNQDLTFKMLKALYISNDIKLDNNKFEENLGLKTDDGKYNLIN